MWGGSLYVYNGRLLSGDNSLEAASAYGGALALYGDNPTLFPQRFRVATRIPCPGFTAEPQYYVALEMESAACAGLSVVTVWSEM